MLTQRLQVLVSPEQHRRLQRYAEGRGVSVGEAVRDAIDRVAGPAPERRLAALQRVMNAPPVAVPEDIAELEAELDAMLDDA